jgi:hypothetical protein
MISMLIALAAVAAADPTAELRSNDQALLDAFTYGKKAAWEELMAPDGVYVDENGAIFDKTQMLAQIRPLGPGVSGTLVVADYKLRLDGDVALVVHRDDETELWHGHALKAQYLTTETWKRDAGGAWKITLAHVYVVAKDPPAVAMPAEVLDPLVGRYEAAAGVDYDVARQGDGLTIARKGRTAEPFRFEGPDLLFVPGKPRFKYHVQRDAAGRVTGFIERREGEDIAWVKAS